MAKDISLDFANTAEWHAGPCPDEQLTSFDKAVAWAEGAGVLSEAQAGGVRERARRDPTKQAEALRRIIALREAIYRVFSAVAQDSLADPADIDLLNAELSVALGHLRLVEAAGQEVGGGPAAAKKGASFGWSWTGMEDDLTSLLWPVARAATALLTSPELAKVRECADETCGWLFLDQSRNASRRWCDMADCGNRAKARRYRERKKEDPAAGS
jgi:predicted RNA-binding Zn ribbon-like protein